MPEQLPNEEFAAIALFGFMGWLASREQVSGPFSANHDPRQAADLIQEFCQSQGWQLKNENWIDQLKDYPI